MKSRRLNDQKGFASLVIAIILVLVLSLTTVGFATLMRREQRSSLDKQLSNQAFYAAESGVNDAAKAINNGFTVAKKNCDPLNDGNLPSGIDATSLASAKQYLYNPTLPDGRNSSIVNDNTGSRYTCLLIDPTPPNLEYNLNDTSRPLYTELTGVNNSDPNDVKQIATLLISWEDSSGSTSYVPNLDYKFSAAGGINAWPYVGLVKLGITPLTSNGIGRDKLVNQTYTAFLYPNDSASGASTDSPYVSGSGAQGGILVNGGCSNSNTPRDCHIRITNVDYATLLLTLEPIYKASNVTIQAYDSSGNGLRFKGAQTLVDVTGKAQDVLRRIQVRIPNANNYAIPEGSKGILCKQLDLSPAATSRDNTTCPIP